jgi:uracil DNA glycosylase
MKYKIKEDIDTSLLGIHPSWNPFFVNQKKKLNGKLTKCYTIPTKYRLSKSYKISPMPTYFFRPFRMDLKDVRVVLIGRHPEKFERMANNLGAGIHPMTRGFVEKHYNSLPNAIKGCAVSLKKMYPLYDPLDFDYSLESWEEQGVLILNESMTVPSIYQPKAHANVWRPFLQKLLTYISLRSEQHVTFVFSGVPMSPYKDYILYDNFFHGFMLVPNLFPPYAFNSVLQGRGLVDPKHFKRINDELLRIKTKPINFVKNIHSKGKNPLQLVFAYN